MTAGRWAGFAVAILASGPSMTKEDAALVRRWRFHALRRRVIVVNTTYQLAPWADLLYASDRRWWEYHHASVLMDFAGERWTCDSKYERPFEGMNTIPLVRGEGLSKKPGMILGGGNSGYQAIALAHHFGAKRIVLLGFDMQRTGGQEHWHGEHPRPLRQNNMYRGWLPKFPALARDLEAAGVEVVNCSRETAISCFARAALEDVLESAQQEPVIT